MTLKSLIARKRREHAKAWRLYHIYRSPKRLRALQAITTEIVKLTGAART